MQTIQHAKKVEEADARAQGRRREEADAKAPRTAGTSGRTRSHEESKSSGREGVRGLRAHSADDTLESQRLSRENPFGAHRLSQRDVLERTDLRARFQQERNGCAQAGALPICQARRVPCPLWTWP